VANPALARDLPPPGWLADRRADWVAASSGLRTADVAEEIEFPNRAENLLVLAGNPLWDNLPLAREAQLAIRNGMLRNDIAATDGLAAQLQALPACAPAAAAISAKEAATPAATAPKPSAAPAGCPGQGGGGGRGATVTLRYDGKVVALTPLRVHAFNQGV
jgi:hypothetical protein